MSSWLENLIVVLVGIAAVAYIGKHTSILLVKLKFKSDLYKFKIALRDLQIKFLKELDSATSVQSVSSIRGYIDVKAKLVSELQLLIDSLREDALRRKKHPAKKSADEVAIVKKEKRELSKSLTKLQGEQAYLEALFPQIYEAREHLLSNDVEVIDSIDLDEIDPVRRLISPEEYKNLSTAQRNDLSLERYLSKNLSKLEIGRLYERYLGYLAEDKGWYVEYKGILSGFEDLGRDLICIKGNEVEIVQAKNWSSRSVIRENVIFQLYATTIEYSMVNPNKKVKAVLATTTELSSVATEIALRLGIEVRQIKLDKTYPMIKCNSSSNSKEKIYHLPFDQQYDKLAMSKENGRFYLSSAAEAEQQGFRRAYRWKGSSSVV
jgi:hypothetical protein